MKPDVAELLSPAKDRREVQLEDGSADSPAVRTAFAGARVLDFCCGSGNLTRHLLELGFEVVAADVSERFLALVERRFEGAPLTTTRQGSSPN